MKIIVGLGNPGAEYEKTRHNAGFLVVDELALRHGAAATTRARFRGAALDAVIGGQKCLLFKPLTYMNLSGQAVAEAVRFFKVDPASDLLVALDEIALPVGMIRLRAGGGTAGHNGLKDIDRLLGGEQYPRCRVGVGKTPPGWKQADWVLSRFEDRELPDVRRSVREAADAAEVFVREGIDAAMNRFNKRVPGDEPRPADRGEDRAGPGRDSAAGGAKDDIHPGWSGG